MDSIKILFEMQNASVKKNQLEKMARTLPQVKELKQLKTEIEQAQSEIHKLKPEIESYRHELKKEELIINGYKDKAKAASDHLYSGEITNVKELENAKNNLESEQEKIRHLEEKALVVMENIDGTENKMRAMLKDLEIKKTKFREVNKEYISQKENITKSIQEIDTWFDSAQRGLQQDLVETFRTLCKRFDDGQGIALLKNGICSGCHMSVSFDNLKKAKNAPGDLICDNCGRWLIPE